MKSGFKLYWVRTPASEEDTFVVARSKRAAQRYEENYTGFNTGDCFAELVTTLETEWARGSYGEREPLENAQAFYPAPDALQKLGIEEVSIEGDVVFRFAGKEYRQTGGLNYIASLADDPEPAVIRSVSDLLEILSVNKAASWIFRGHSSSNWTLQAGIYRMLDQNKLPADQVQAFERRILSEFIRRARVFLPQAPNSVWEWLVLAQHFSLPTRLLDWTENPLVALYFAVRDNTGNRDDGVLYCYRHSRPEIDIQSSDDPFTIKKIEMVRPPYLDQRLIAQQSVFTAEPPGFSPEKNQSGGFLSRHVACSSAAEIRQELSKLGVSENTVFPGLEGLAADIKRECAVWLRRP